MSIFIDIVLVAIFAVFVIIFSKNGFARTIYKIGKTWLSLFCSFVLGPIVAKKIQEWFLQDAFTKGINNTLTDVVSNNPNGYSLQELFQNLPKGLLNFLDNYGISLPALEAEYGSSTEATPAIIKAISERIAEPCSEMAASLIGHIFCFVFTLIFLAWLNFEIRKRRVAFFRFVDHITGFLIGIAVGYCAVLGISVLLHTIFQVIVAFNVNSPVVAVYDNSYIFKFMNEFDMWGMIKQLWMRIF